MAESALELEAMREEDSSWHPCTVSLSSAEDALIINFGSQDSEDVVLNDEEALKHLRFRSAPLQGDDCSRIKEGEHVLATDDSQFKSRFYDAKIEKVVRVRHLKKVRCRCTFIIKWLHQDPEGESLTVPSSSIMKLTTKSIDIHPAVAVFSKSVKKMGLSNASSFTSVLNDTDGEMDLNKLLAKQIEEISNSANASKKEISEDILLGVKVDDKGQIQCKTITASRVGISHAQVPHDQNQLKRSTRSSKKLQEDMHVEGPPSPASIQEELHASIQEELQGNRSHLSPLAARAALASLVSINDKHITMDGTKIFNTCVIKNLHMEDQLSSEISDASIPIFSNHVKMVNPLISTEMGVSSKPQLVELSSGITTKVNENESESSEFTDSGVSLTCSIRERNPSLPTKTARMTRSAVRKGTEIQNDDVPMKTCSEDTKLRASNESESPEFTDSDVSLTCSIRERNPSQSTKTARMTRSAVRKGTEIQNDDVRMKTCSEDTKLRASNESESPEFTDSGVHLTCSIRERKLSHPAKTARMTRSAVQKDTEIQNDDVQMKTCSEETKLASTKIRRLTRSAGNEEKENLFMELRQVLEEKKSTKTKSGSSEGDITVPESNVSKKRSGVSTEKKAVSSPLDAETVIPVEERNKKHMSGKVSGNSQGLKRKGTSSKNQEQRFSPRLRFLPRTRSQTKS